MNQDINKKNRGCVEKKKNMRKFCEPFWLIHLDRLFMSVYVLRFVQVVDYK